MKKATKAIVIALCAVLLVAGSVMGTLAWLTSTASVKNIFTVGKVEITLTETTGSEYKIIPGKTIEKDPTVRVTADSENCYLFVKVTNELTGVEANVSGQPTIADQMLANGWKLLSGNVYYYDGVKATNSIVTKNTEIPVFTHLYVGTEHQDLSAYDNKTIEIIAYAVQADGLDSAEKAWQASGFGA